MKKPGAADEPLQENEIMQIGDTHPSPTFRYCLMVVSEPKPWGAQGYVLIPGATLNSAPAPAYVRVEWKDMERTGGFVVWAVKA